MKNRAFLLFVAIFFMANSLISNAQTVAKDVHSYANPQVAKVKHIDLDWTVLFEQKSIKGSATLTIERTDQLSPLILDARDLNIEKVEMSDDGKSFVSTTFGVGTADKFLGSPLTIQLSPKAKFVRVFYSTSPTAGGLQWLSPEQTAGKKSPYMFSQAQSILARTFIPLQDSPNIRVTYNARVRTPKNLLAVMSAAGNSQTNTRTGDYRFSMKKPIPSYLIAIAVGDIRFKSLGKRTGVYSEPSMLAKSAFELSDTEKMVVATEKIYGKYAWDRYDLLVLPPSFPFGGMENPMLTFATPTILAGDKSLVSLVAHELAHSWSGNLVTNATWRDFWLNEGFTTYLERRIIEEVYGKNRREMEAMLGKKSLLEEMADLPEADQIMHVNLDGRDPDEGFTGVPYEKGALFLRYLEEKFGREKFDKFVKDYFAAHAFQSITTATFKEYLFENLLNKYPDVVSVAEVDEWIEKGGLPKTAPNPQSENFKKAENIAMQFLDGKFDKPFAFNKWTTQEWLHFLKTLEEDFDKHSLKKDYGASRMAKLDKMYNFTKIGNSEIAFQWLMIAIKNDYEAADARVEQFLTTIGRRKFVRPLFAELVKTPFGLERAKAIYAKARSGYHPITQGSIDAILKK